jgi:hypothetical protein
VEKLILNDVIGWDKTRLSDQERDEFEAREGMRSVREAVEGLGVPGIWTGVRDDIMGKIGDLLDVTLIDVFRRAWNKTRELTKYRNREKYPPDKTFVVPLADHKITSRHTPHIEIRADGVPTKKVNFEIRLEIALKGIRLHIRDARIRSIDIGECLGKGTLFCEGFLLAQQKSRKLELTGSIDLGDGIEI